MKEIRQGIMVPLGHGKFVKSDAIIAVEPLDGLGQYWKSDGNSNKLRTRVLIAHEVGVVLASRTAETILKNMTVQDEPVGNLNNFGKAIIRLTKVLPDGISPSSDGITEKAMVIHSLIYSSTVKAAIAASPFGQTKFYELVKKYGINTKSYMEATDDPDSYDDLI